MFSQSTDVQHARFGHLFLAVASWLLALGVAHAASAGSGSTSVQGLWQGHGGCGKAPASIGFDLRLKAVASGDVFGVVETYTPPGIDKPYPPGSYRVSGHVTPEGKLQLNPVEWIKQPAPNLVMGTLDGNVSADGKSYAGTLHECKGGVFTVAKTSDNTDVPAEHSDATLAGAVGGQATAGAAAVPDQLASTAETGGFWARVGSDIKKGLMQANDPLIVRGYILVNPRDISQNPLCLYDLATHELQSNGVFGHVSMHQDGSPSFTTTKVSIFGCVAAEESGRLVVTDYTDMSPAKTPFKGKKGTPSLGQTSLAGLFARTPFDGTPRTYFPRVSITVTDWTTTPGCWIARATVWESAAKSSEVSAFNVCWPRGGDAMGTANRLMEGDQLMNQVDSQKADANTGNVRTPGPKAPMRGLPERYPTSVARGPYLEFLHALTFGTGWVAGAPTNLWIVGFNPD